MKKLNYAKLISKAAELSNKGKDVYGSEVYFYDHLDWEVVKDRGVWTDVFLSIGEDSVFAFTISSSFAGRGFLQGSVPESFRDLDTGCWDLYIHKKYITHDDVGNACKKWIQLQGRLYKTFLCNVRFNDKQYGTVFEAEQYPPERLYTPIDDIYAVESFVGPLREVKTGVCS